MGNSKKWKDPKKVYGSKPDHVVENIPSTIKQRIILLETFRRDLILFFERRTSREEAIKLRSSINRMLAGTKTAVQEAGVFRKVTFLTSGSIYSEIDPFDNIFESPFGTSPIPGIIDLVDQAIGVYENLEKNPELVRTHTADPLDIVGSLDRALRPAFRQKPPSDERDVIDAVETIFNAIGVEYTREREIAVVGPRGFVPDFVVRGSLAVEVKLAKIGHKAGEIQEELAADIAAYKTKWKRFLGIIYDLGFISDPYGMRKENMKHFGVTILIVKH